MLRNVGKSDSLIRVLLGLALVVLGLLFGNNFFGYVLVFLGIISFVTGFVRWCPIYSFFNFSSKGHGVDKITKKDIQKAVKEHPIEVKTKAKKKSTKKTTSKKSTSKAKKTTSKKTAKKTSKASSKTTKKASTSKSKKKSTKKTTSKKSTSKNK